MLDCSIRSCFLSNQPLTVFPGHYVHLKISLQDVATVWWEKQIGSLLLRNAVEGNKLGKASPKLVQPLMTFSSISSWILAGIMTWQWQQLSVTFCPPQFPGYCTHRTQMMTGSSVVCGLYYVFAFIFERPKKKSLSNCTHLHRGWWASSCRPTLFTRKLDFGLGVARPTLQMMQESLKQPMFLKKTKKTSCSLLYSSWWSSHERSEGQKTDKCDRAWTSPVE